MTEIEELGNQYDAISIIMLMYKEGPVHVRQLKKLGYADKTFYRVLRLLYQKGIIKAWIEDGPFRRMKRLYYLTPEGEQIAKLLEQADRILVEASKKAVKPPR